MMLQTSQSKKQVLVPHLKNIYFGQEKSQKINKQMLKKQEMKKWESNSMIIFKKDNL